jgi:rhodanese-related sulfurtransferase
MDASQSQTIGLEKTRERMGTDANILDIRPDEEWRKVGNIPGAISASEDDAAEVAAEQIDEERTVIVVCEDGERSARVAEQLRESGRDAVALDGGMTAWSGAGMPMQPTEDPALASDPGSVEDEVSGESESSGADDERDEGDAARDDRSG